MYKFLSLILEMRNPFFNVVVRGVQHVTPQDMPNTQKYFMSTPNIINVSIFLYTQRTFGQLRCTDSCFIDSTSCKYRTWGLQKFHTDTHIDMRESLLRSTVFSNDLRGFGFFCLPYSHPHTHTHSLHYKVQLSGTGLFAAHVLWC